LSGSQSELFLYSRKCQTLRVPGKPGLTPRASYLAKGKDFFEVNGRTVGECLNQLVSLVPVMKETLFYESGRLVPTIKVLVNQESDDAEGLAKN